MKEGTGTELTSGSDQQVTRRDVLAGTGAAVLAGFAGCNAEGNDIVDSTDTFGHVFPYDPDSVQLNPWPGASYPYDFYTMLFEPLSVQVPGDGRRLGDVLEAVRIDGPTVTVEFADSYTWWNGEPVTARDKWVYERIQSAVGDSERPPVDQVDEHTLEYEFESELARPVVLSHVAGEALNTADWVFDRWVDRLDAAATDSARDDVVDELQDWRYSLDEAEDEGFGNGPYELTEVSINRVMLEQFNDHPRAGDIDIPRLWFPVIQQISRDKFIAEGKLDGGRGLVASLKESPPDFIEQFDQYQSTNGAKLALDWRHPDLGRPEVRQAMLAVLPLDRIADIGEFGDPKPVQTGMAEPAERRWLSDEFVAGLETHPVAKDSERAAEFMRAAGYTREDEYWHSPDGDRVEFRFRSPIWDDWKATGELIASSFDEFGFEVDYTQISNTRLVTDVRTHNFDVMLWFSDARPYRVYDVSSTSSATIGYGTTDPGAETSEQGKPIEVSVPTADGSKTVNLVEQWERLRRASGADVTTDAIETFARWWNADIPDVQLATQVTGVWGNTRDFEWPDADRTTFRESGPGNRPEYRLLKHGSVTSADR